MNQNFPPNPPGQSGDSPSGDQGYDPNAQSNPYYAAQQQQAPQQPNLDAGAPQLKTVESQRLDRKALMFMGGIVILLILMTLVVMRKSGSDSEEEAKKPREEKVVIPDLPKGAGTPGGPDFAELPPPEAQPVPVQELPPLPPPEEPRQANNRRGGDRGDNREGPEEPRGPTLVERRMGITDTGRGGYQGATAGGQPNDPVLDAMLGNLRNAQQMQAGGAPAAAPREAGSKVSMAQYQRNPDTLLVRGTYIRCVLETRIITDVDGFTSCIVTEPVYSINGRKLLLPKGSKALGRYSGEPKGPRVAVVWDRITTPTGLDVALQGPGVDNLGGAGHPGDYNGHWFSRMSSALMISLISDAFKYYAAEEGPQTDSVTTGGNVVTQPFESNTAKTMERLANQALSKSMQRPATVTINQGTVLNIYVAQDVDFSGVIRR